MYEHGTITVLALVPALTEPGLLPGGPAPYTENLLRDALPAFVVTAIVRGRNGVRERYRPANPSWFAVDGQARADSPAALAILSDIAGRPGSADLPSSR